jgi:hypothetical protein
LSKCWRIRGAVTLTEVETTPCQPWLSRTQGKRISYIITCWVNTQWWDRPP